MEMERLEVNEAPVRQWRRNGSLDVPYKGSNHFYSRECGNRRDTHLTNLIDTTLPPHLILNMTLKGGEVNRQP